MVHSPLPNVELIAQLSDETGNIVAMTWEVSCTTG